MSKIEEKGKLLKKTKLGKKTVLGNKTQEIKEQIIVVGNKINKEQKENKASFLLKLIIKALKYYSRKTNKQRMNFKKLINEISLVINKSKSKYFNEIYQKIDKLPIPKNIKHDKNYGTLKIVNKDILNKKNIEYNKDKENNNFESNKNDILKYMVPNYINIINQKKNNINNNDDRYVEDYENYNYNSNYEDKEKGPDYDNNFNEVEYNEEEDIDNYNINKNSQNYINNEVEEDTYFQNEYYYNQDNANYNNNKGDEYYQQDNYYYNEPNYNYYYENDETYNQNNNNYYYNDYYEEPYQNEDINYELKNRVDFYKSVGNNVIISDIYVKPKVESNKYNYNKNNYETNIYRSKMNNSKRAFPFSTHNHVFYISK